MPTTIPSRDITVSDKKYFRAKVIEMATNRAMATALVRQAEELSFRDLGAADLGLIHGWQTSKTSAHNFTQWINYIVPSITLLCIYKVLQLSAAPTVTTLRFRKNYGTLGLHDLESCYNGLPIMEALSRTLMSKENKEVLDRLAGRDNEVSISPDFGSPMEAYFSEPYIFEPNQTIDIEVFSHKDGDGDYLVLGGYVVEPRGLTVS